MRFLCSLGAALALAAVPAHAQSPGQFRTAQEYLDARSKGGLASQLIMLALGGYTEGFMWTNSYLEKVRKEAPLFCPPTKLPLDAELAASILERYVRDQPKAAKDPVGLTLLLAFQRTFPC